jgi:hypothetical protein
MVSRKAAMDLDQRFRKPFLAGDRMIVTLQDAAELYQGLSSKAVKESCWEIFFEYLTRAGHHGGLWIDLCEIALRQALNGQHEPEFDPNEKMTHWGNRRKRDPWR